MGETFQKRITALLLSNKRHSRYVAMVACMAVAVVFGVTVGLTQEGQAKTHEEKVLDCQYSGDGAHTHDASCYDADGNLVCTLAEREYHVHDDSCYASETHVVCGMEEGEGAHTHDESCYDEEGNLVCGLEESAGHVHTDECYQTDTWLACGKEEVTEEHVHGEGCFKTIIVEDEPAEAPVEPAKTEAAKAATAESGEQTFTGELKDADGNVIVSVAVKAPKGALPDGATMRVKAVDEAAIKDKVDEAVKAEAGDNAVAKSIAAVDIAFLDKDGNEVEPSKKVEVKITSAAVRDIEAPALVHIDEKTDAAEVVHDTTKVNADDKDTSTGNEDTLKFDTDQFSPYVIVETEELHGELLTGNGGVYDVVVTAGPEAGIPADAQLQVTELADTSDEYLSAFDEVVAQKKAQDENFDEASLGMAAFDITIVDANGNPFEPLAPVNVTVNIAQLPAEIVESTAELQHLDTSTGETVVETVATVADETLAIDGETAVAEFELSGFSTFTLTWNNGNNSATIHYGYLDTTTDKFVDFEQSKVAELDTTAASVNVANNFDGYSYIGCTYKASSSANEFDMTNSILKKVDGGWQITHKTSTEEDAETVTENIANDSEIYVYYGEKKANPATPTEGEIPTPVTQKTVKVNDDGTATVTIDITGTKVTETQQTGANVLIVLDNTYSMASSMTGAANRFEAARSAILTLIDTLDCGTNDIDLALVEFNAIGSIKYNWTKDYTTVRSYIADTAQHASGPSGTNWESGLYYARQVLNSKDSDATYVIFLTDGEPNRRGTTTSTNAGTSTAISYALTQAQAITSTANTSLYGVFCGSASGYNNLNNMINNANGEGTINGTDAQGIKDAFAGIASTIVQNLGASGASVDDGVTQLSSVSAQVASGTAGGYKYYIKPEGEDEFKEWNDAPGASFSDDNGVTWDLSAVGALPAGTTYRVEFTVWPSQEALDLIANLNNGTVDIDDLSDVVKSQISGNKTSGYTLATNTHLNTTYSFQGNTYTDPITPLPNGAMPLASEQMNVAKAWEDSINTRNRADGVEFYLLVDGAYYLDGNGDRYVLEAVKDDWTDSVYIAPGMAVDGQILETGHKYTLEEKAAYKLDEGGNKDYSAYQDYSMEFTSQTVRPMKIDGQLVYLVMIDENNPAPAGATTYTINDSNNTITIGGTAPNWYAISGTGSGTMTGTNYKTAELDITKHIDEDKSVTDLTDAQLDEETFSYTVSFTFPQGSDPSGVGYWLYTPTADGWSLAEYDSDAVNYQPDNYTNGKKFGGSSSTSIWEGAVPSTSEGAVTQEVTVTLTRSDIIRFTNLPTGTTYKIVESAANGSGLATEGYSVDTIASTNGTVSKTTLDKDTVSGTIEEPNTRYYNQFTNVIKAVDVDIAGTKKLEGYEWSGESYHFTLAGTESSPMPTAATDGVTEFDLTAESGNDDQTDTFGRLRFTSAGSYTYTVSETNAGSLQVVNGKVVQFGEAATVTIEVEEDATTHALSIKSVSGAELSDDSKTVTASITNTAPTTSVSAIKQWQDASGEAIEAPDGATVTFTLYQDGTATDQTVELDGTVDENGETDAWTATFSDLQQYKVADDGTPEPIVYTIGETTQFSGYDLVTTDPVANGGTIINKQGTFWVQFKKTNMTDTPLANAVFSFDNGGEDELTLTSGNDGILATSGDNPVNKFELAIDDEGSYGLTETTAPAGYLKSAEDVKVFVKASGVSATGPVKSEVTGEGTEESPFVVTITNTDGAELPNSGGPGTTLFTITGTAIIAVAVTYGIASRRRRERGLN